MAHVMKMTKAAIGHMFKHYERAKDNAGEYFKFSNQDIDPARSCLNYNLAPERNISQGDFVRQRCSEVYCLNRRDVNLGCSWIVTLPKDYQELNPKRNADDFFKGVYDFLEKRYGRENVVSAYVHMDEVTPHMHYCFVPVVQDKRRGFKVSAKECVSKLDLQTFHDDLEKHLWYGHGLHCSILNGATRDGNRSIEELKRGEASQKLLNASKRLEEVVNEVSHAEERKRALNGEIRRLEGKILSIQEVDMINVKKTLTGALKGITYEDILNLKKTALLVESVKNDIQLVEARYKELDQERRRVAKEREDLSRIPLRQQTEMAELKERVRKAESVIADVQDTLGVLPEGVKKQFIQAYWLQKEGKSCKKTCNAEHEV